MQKFYGIVYYSDSLFSFDPVAGEIEYLDRLASAPNRKSGNVSYSTLAFEISADGNTVYYIVSNEIAGADGRSLNRAVRVRGQIDPVFVDPVSDLPAVLTGLVRDGDIVLTLGAGDIEAVAAALPSVLCQKDGGGS